MTISRSGGAAVLVSPDRIERKILLIRGHKVMLDADLAALYGVATGNLNRAVKRNAARFPPDFMFQLTDGELADLKRQIGISSLKSQWGRALIHRASPS